MKVLAINSSPRSEGETKTGLMLAHLVKGMREAGAEVEVIQLSRKKVRNCIGCYTCWTKTPGVCLHKDDMTRELFPKWLAADMVIYATPLYHFTINAALKAFIERTLPVLQPFFEEHGNRTYHPLRHKVPAVVMLSVAGFPDDAVFEQLSSWTRFIFHKGLAAEIYRAGAELLTVPFFSERSGEILNATEQAGRQLVEGGGVAPETMALIRQPILEDKKAWRMMGNLMWKTCIAQGMTPKEFNESGLAPRPDSIETFMLIMSMGFNPANAAELKAVVQFDFSGDVEGSCHFIMEGGKIGAMAGEAKSPDLIIETPFGLWLDIMAGKVDGGQALLNQEYRISGDASILMRMRDLFHK